MKKADAIEEAHRIILEDYGQVAPAAERMSWQKARKKLQEEMLADGKRERTVRAYLETLKRLEELFPLAKGPSDITDRMAGDFKTKYANGHYTKKRILKEGENAPAYKRRPETLDSRLRMLKASFGWRRGLVWTGFRSPALLVEAGQSASLVTTQPLAYGLPAGLESPLGGTNTVVQGVLHQMDTEIKGMVFGTSHGKVRHRAHTIPSLEWI